MTINNTKWNKIRYSLYAPFYNMIKNIFKKGRQRSIELLEIKPKEKILIVGVGTGLEFEYLSKDSDITAIDLDKTFVTRDIV